MTEQADGAAGQNPAGNPNGANKCRCGIEPGAEPHYCPYAYDVHDDKDTQCNCCETCTQSCADDI